MAKKRIRPSMSLTLGKEDFEYLKHVAKLLGGDEPVSLSEANRAIIRDHRMHLANKDYLDSVKSKEDADD